MNAWVKTILMGVLLIGALVIATKVWEHRWTMCRDAGYSMVVCVFSLG